MKKKFEAIRFTEKMVNDGLKKALRERDATDSIKVFIQHLGEQSESERVYIFEGLKGCPVNNTFEWCAPNVSEEKENLQGVPFEAVEVWYNTFETKDCVVIKNLEDIRETEPMAYEYLKPQNVHSLIVAPLILEDCIIGFWGVDNPPVHLLEYTEDMSEIVAHFIVSLLEKRRLVKELEKMSFKDPLTGGKNRHALSVDLGVYENVKNVGVLYCDVLGLKRVNDTQGHQAGDRLLVRAIQCLQEVFRKKEVYRVGGDEFMVVCIGIEEKLFMEKVEKVRILMQEREALMSIGVIWKEETGNLEALIGEADEIMYEEKRAYYAVKGKHVDYRS